MCPLCLSVVAIVGIVLARARRRNPAPDPTKWRLSADDRITSRDALSVGPSRSALNTECSR